MTSTVHPHVRGVYRVVVAGTVEPDGPSPRAWGLQHNRKFCRSHNRSIPTCVGFTQAATGPQPVPAVHPHVRGVYAFQTGYNAGANGPSPRAWGLH